jgi:tRNA-2-methylthio-N6-dimethylallyladenosine synthase
MVEDIDDHDSRCVTGRMTNNILVHFPGSSDLIGNITNVRLTECKGFYYLGEQEK